MRSEDEFEEPKEYSGELPPVGPQEDLEEGEDDD